MGRQLSDRAAIDAPVAQHFANRVELPAFDAAAEIGDPALSARGGSHHREMKDRAAGHVGGHPQAPFMSLDD
jgi:hypothetical protein